MPIEDYDDDNLGEVRRLFIARNINLAPGTVPVDVQLQRLVGCTEWHGLTFRYWGASVNPTAARFGIYTAINGGGNAIVAAASSFNALAAATDTSEGTVSSRALQTSAPLFLRITTAHTAACTLAGLAVYGVVTTTR